MHAVGYCITYGGVMERGEREREGEREGEAVEKLTRSANFVNLLLS